MVTPVSMKAPSLNWQSIGNLVPYSDGSAGIIMEDLFEQALKTASSVIEPSHLLIDLLEYLDEDDRAKLIKDLKLKIDKIEDIKSALNLTPCVDPTELDSVAKQAFKKQVTIDRAVQLIFRRAHERANLTGDRALFSNHLASELVISCMIGPHLFPELVN